MPDAPPVPVTPRPAASLLVIRETASGPEVLMGLRGAGHKFMPNRLVFPGGAVDPEDHGAPVAVAPQPGVLARLRISATPELAAAFLAAAARELEEETSLTLGSPPALGRLDYICRAITPEASPVRFDARFFVVDAGEVSGEIAGSGELEDLRYFSVTDALALDLAFATRSVVQRLQTWRAMTPAERLDEARVPVILNRVWVWEG